MIVNSRSELSDYVLYTLGFKDQSELKEQFQKLMRGEKIESREMEFNYDELMGMRFKLLVNTDVFERNGTLWADRSGNPDFIAKQLENAQEIQIVGILRPAEGSVATATSGGIGYRRELMDGLLQKVNNSEIVKEQMANPGIDVFTGQPFSSDAQDVVALIDSMEVSEFLTLLEENGLIPQGMIPKAYWPLLSKDLLKQFVGAGSMMLKGSSLEDNLEKMGVSDPDKPAAILIYPKDFESKNRITDLIEEYNKEAGEKAVRYTDYVGLLMNSVTTIIDAISYVLIAFVSISLVVSSIMIGIITYISVLERTKEIGILRAIGASRRDVSRVFNAETLIVGFAAGVMGILVTLGLIVIANIILGHLTGIPDIAALPAVAGAILVGISMLLTLIAGIIPSRIASRKDPVVALRTE